MARLAVLNDTQTRRDERREERRAFAEAERAHSERISENYRRLLYDNAEETTAQQDSSFAATATLERTAPAALDRMAFAPVHEQAPAAPSPAKETEAAPAANTAQRLADYVAYTPAAGNKRMLFEGLLYKNGELIDTTAAPAAPAPVAAPVQAPAAPAPVSAPEEEDDALPTRRTMETLRHAEVLPETAGQAGLWAALSLKTKLVLCAIAAAIVLAVVIICINTGILSSVNADIALKSTELQSVTQTYRDLQTQIEGIDNADYIAQWAQENGMVPGGN